MTFLFSFRKKNRKLDKDWNTRVNTRLRLCCLRHIGQVLERREKGIEEAGEINKGRKKGSSIKHSIMLPQSSSLEERHVFPAG